MALHFSFEEDAAGGWLAVPYVTCLRNGAREFPMTHRHTYTCCEFTKALYVAFVVLALTNIATGMFVQASLGAHERQREKATSQQS